MVLRNRPPPLKLIALLIALHPVMRIAMRIATHVAINPYPRHGRRRKVRIHVRVCRRGGSRFEVPA